MIDKFLYSAFAWLDIICEKWANAITNLTDGKKNGRKNKQKNIRSSKRSKKKR